MLEGYIMCAPDGEVSVSRLRKLYQLLALKGDVPFSDYLEDILDKDQRLSKVTKTDEETGKKRKYISELSLTGRGKRFLAERTL
jgi:hypothetical protein